MSAPKTKAAFWEFRLLYDSGDPWGCTMSFWFAVADELHTRIGSTPREWFYRPSPCAPSNEPDAYETEVVEGLDVGTLVRFGRALSRYADKLRAAGLNY